MQTFWKPDASDVWTEGIRVLRFGKRSFGLVVCTLAIVAEVLASDAEPRVNGNSGRVYWQMRGNALFEAGNYVDAAQAFRTALSLAESSQPDDRVLATIHDDLASSYAEEGRFAESEREIQVAMSCVARTQGSRSLDYALLLARLSLLPTHTGSNGGAIQILQKAISDNHRSLSARELALGRDFLAKLLYGEGRDIEAEAILTDTRSALNQEKTADADLLAELNNDLGVVRQHLQRYAEAADAEIECLRLLEAKLGAENRALVPPLNNLGVIYAGMRDLYDADQTFQRALSLSVRTLGPEHPTHGEVLMNYAAVLRRLGHKQESRKMKSAAEQILRASNRHNGVGATISVVDLQNSPD